MDKAFTVSLCNPDKDTYVTLELPADPYAVLDAWERLRLAPDTRVEWEMEDYGEFPVLFPGLQSGEGFPALNALAERLTSLDSRQRTAFEGLVKLQDGRPMEPDALITLSEQAKHCQVAPEATDDASLGRVYAANGSIPEVKDVPDKVFELLDFQLLGRRIRQSAGGVFTRQGYVVPDGNWKPTEGQEPRIAP
ncbi:antirestriction protein ArdA, partial [Flavonifractor plautii]